MSRTENQVAGRLRIADGLERELEYGLSALAEYSDARPGVTRLAWTPTHMKACAWLVERMRAAGLSASADRAGNVIGRLAGDRATGGAVVIGSHIDSVPHGGRYDGALGVLAGLAVCRSLRRERDHLRRPLWVAAFMDEEGARFGASYFGSRAFAGEDLPALDLTDADGVSIAEAMKQAGYEAGLAASARQVDAVEAYLELHVEQGPVLDRSGVPVGIVTGFVGRRVFRIFVEGASNHAGTTPPEERHDALRAATHLATELYRFADAMAGTVNIGRLDTYPGAVNVIPGSVVLDVEFRAPAARELANAEQALRSAIRGISSLPGISVRSEPLDSADPVKCDPELTGLLERVAEEAKVPTASLVSGAGHDALVMARHVPTGMLMVPSRNGVSHSPDEHTTTRQCALGTSVLERAVRELTLEGGVS